MLLTFDRIALARVRGRSLSASRPSCCIMHCARLQSLGGSGLVLPVLAEKALKGSALRCRKAALFCSAVPSLQVKFSLRHTTTALRVPDSVRSMTEHVLCSREHKVVNIAGREKGVRSCVLCTVSPSCTIR